MTGILDLPDELLVHIIGDQRAADHFNFALACRRFAACSRDVLQQHQRANDVFCTVWLRSPQTASMIFDIVRADHIAAWNVRSIHIDERSGEALHINDRQMPYLRGDAIHKLVNSRFPQCERWVENTMHSWPGVHTDRYIAAFRHIAANLLLSTLCPRLTTIQLAMYVPDSWQIDVVMYMLLRTGTKHDATTHQRLRVVWPGTVISLRRVELNRTWSAGFDSMIKADAIASILKLPFLEWLYVGNMSELPSGNCISMPASRSLRHLILSRLRVAYSDLWRLLKSINALDSFVLEDLDPEYLKGLGCQKLLRGLHEKQPDLQTLCVRSTERHARFTLVSDDGCRCRHLDRYPDLLQPLQHPRHVGINIGDAASTIRCTSRLRVGPGIPLGRCKRSTQSALPLGYDMPRTVEVLRLVNTGVVSLSVADLDADFTAFLNAKSHAKLRCLDLSRLQTSLPWERSSRRRSRLRRRWASKYSGRGKQWRRNMLRLAPRRSSMDSVRDFDWQTMCSDCELQNVHS